MTTNTTHMKQTKTTMAQKLGISRGMVYYKHKRDVTDEALKETIQDVMNIHQSYGHKRIAIELHMNKKKVLRIMKKFHLMPKKRRSKKPVKTDDMNKPATGYLNHIETLCPIRANSIWVGDFTHILFQDGWIYLATVMDLYTREIIGWHLSTTHTKDLIITAFLEAVKARDTTPVYFHSDQGSEYDSRAYTDLVRRHGVIISMSRKAHPWENGYQESFYSGFKLDLGDTRQHCLLGEIFEAIAGTLHYYNHTRIHTALKTSPLQFRISQEHVFNELGT
jgi:transposase InsO family protein